MSYGLDIITISLILSIEEGECRDLTNFLENNYVKKNDLYLMFITAIKSCNKEAIKTIINCHYFEDIELSSNIWVELFLISNQDLLDFTLKFDKISNQITEKLYQCFVPVTNDLVLSKLINYQKK